MFSLDDFTTLLLVLKDNTTASSGLVDPNYEAFVRNAQSKSKIMFESIIDQTCFKTQDYLRIRSFIIDWYSSHRAMIDISKNSKDIFSLPNTYLNELFKSFGYYHNLDLIPPSSKPYLFLDLVNLYKVKGTIRGLYQLLSYYGLSDVEISEYWVTKSSRENKIIFKEQEVYPQIYNTTDLLLFNQELNYDEVTAADPHWMMSENDIITKNNLLKINLPSKSPYFSIKFRNKINNTKVVSAILIRKVINEYNVWLEDGTLNKPILIKKPLIEQVSLLELYLVCCYLFEIIYNGQYGNLNITATDRFLCYSGDQTLTDEQILALYEKLISTRPQTQEDRRNLQQEFQDTFTMPAQGSFVDMDPGTLLASINQSLKKAIDDYLSISVNIPTSLLTYLFNVLSDYVKYNIGIESSYFSNYVFGNLVSELEDSINFFKPYRARLINIVSGFIFRNPMDESVIVTDSTMLEIDYNPVDFITGDLKPQTISEQTRSVYDYQGLFDLGACTDFTYMDVIEDNPTIRIDVTSELHTTLNCHVGTMEDTVDNGYRILTGDTTSDISLIEHITNSDFSTNIPLTDYAGNILSSYDGDYIETYTQDPSSLIGWTSNDPTGIGSVYPNGITLMRLVDDTVYVYQDVVVNPNSAYYITIKSNGDGTTGSQGRLIIQNNDTPNDFLIPENSPLNDISEIMQVMSYKFATTTHRSLRITVKSPVTIDKACVIYMLSLTEIVQSEYQYGGFFNFDDDGVFDCSSCNDVIDIQIMDLDLYIPWDIDPYSPIPRPITVIPGIYKEFTNNDITGGYLYCMCTATYPIITIYDNNDNVIVPDNIKILVNSTSFSVELKTFSPIEGTWKIFVI